jgi:hypothetical protein
MQKRDIIPISLTMIIGKSREFRKISEIKYTDPIRDASNIVR